MIIPAKTILNISQIISLISIAKLIRWCWISASSAELCINRVWILMCLRQNVGLNNNKWKYADVLDSYGLDDSWVLLVLLHWVLLCINSFVSFLIRFQPDNARLMASWANEHWLLLQRCLTGSFCRAKRKKRVRVSTQEQKHLGWAFLPFQPLTSTLRLKPITGSTLSLHTVQHHALKPERDSLISSASPGQIFQKKAHNMLALHGVKSHFVWELPHTHAAD